MPQPTIGHVFVSYSRRDDAIMHRIVKYLRAQGIKVWVDNERLIPGTPIWEEEIENAIHGASAIIVLLSPDSKKSVWVRREISFAERYNKRIFPIMVAGDEDRSIPLRLSTNQYVDIRKNETAALHSLSLSISSYLNEITHLVDENLGPAMFETEEIEEKSGEISQAIDTDGKSTNTELLLTSQEADQAYGDSYRISIPFTISMAAGMFILKEFIDFDTSGKKLIWSGFFIFLAIYGIFAIKQIGQLHKSWGVSMSTLGKFMKSLPLQNKRGKILKYQAIEIAMLTGLAFGAGLFFLLMVFLYINIITWILCLILGIIIYFVQMKIYQHQLK